MLAGEPRRDVLLRHVVVHQPAQDDQAVQHHLHFAGAPPEALLQELYWHMRRSVSVDGRANLTPSEFTARHKEMFASLPRLSHAARMLTSLYVQATYSPRGPRSEEVEKARRAWRSAWWDRLRQR